MNDLKSANIDKRLSLLTALLCGLEMGVLIYLLCINPFDGFFVTGLVPMALGLCLAVMLVLRRSIASGIRLGAISLIVCLFALDAACLVITQPRRFSSQDREEQARRLGIEYDFRGIPEVIQDLKELGFEAIPNIAPNLIRTHGADIFPLGGVSGATVVLCNESGKFTVYTSDEHGFNNSPGLYASGVEALVIGDSFANGACVRPGEDIAGQLRASGTPALTLGMWGNGPLVELAGLVEYGQRLRPKHVFWLFYENDMEDLRQELGKSFLHNYLTPGFSQNLMDRQAEIDSRLLADLDDHYFKKKKRADTLAGKAYKLLDSRESKNVISVLALHDLVLFAKSLLYDPYPPGDMARFTQIMALANQTSLSWGGRLTFVFLPDFFRYQPVSMIKRMQQDRSKRQIMHAVHGLGLPVIDIDMEFAALNDPVALFPLRIMGHYTPEGYALIASRLRQSALGR